MLSWWGDLRLLSLKGFTWTSLWSHTRPHRKLPWTLGRYFSKCSFLEQNCTHGIRTSESAGSSLLDNRSLGAPYDTRRQGSQNQVTTLGPGKEGKKHREHSKLSRERAALQAGEHVLWEVASSQLWLPCEKNGSMSSDMPVFLQTCKNHILHAISWSLNFGHGEIFHVPKGNTSVLRLMGFHLIVTTENHWFRTNLRTAKLEDPDVRVGP